MKKLLCALLAALMVLSMVAAASAETESKGYKIAVVTGTMSQAIDERAAAMMLESKYGDMITTDVYPDNFTEEKETVIQKIVQYADDPDVKAIVVAQAVPGTAEAFRQVKRGSDERLRGPRLPDHQDRQGAGLRYLRAHLLPPPPGH